MTSVSFNHFGFNVTDLDRSIAWYSDLLGTEPVLRRRSGDPYMGELVGYEGCEMEYAYLPLPGSEATLELIEYASPRSEVVDLEINDVGNSHFCLLVEDIHAEFERLAPKASFRSPAPVAITAGANEGGWSVYLRDPDGITIQLLQPPPESEPGA